jgi:hypothetical protein
VDTPRPSPRTNRTRLVPSPETALSSLPPASRYRAPLLAQARAAAADAADAEAATRMLALERDLRAALSALPAAELMETE